jgi:hypothetical protein
MQASRWWCCGSETGRAGEARGGGSEIHKTDKEEEKEKVRKNENGRTHNLEGEVEGLQKWRVGGGIWRGPKKWRAI